MRLITSIHLHHSAGSELDTPEQVAAYAVGRGIGITHDPYHWHIWRGPDAGVGVNAWLISPGRDEEEVPASVKGHNEGAIAVCVHGRYDVAPLPGYALQRLVGLLVGLLARHGLSVEDVRGHREVGGATVCPGYDPEVVRAAVRRAL